MTCVHVSGCWGNDTWARAYYLTAAHFQTKKMNAKVLLFSNHIMHNHRGIMHSLFIVYMIGFNSSRTLVEHEESFINITCADGYYLSDASGVCRPLCSLWTEPKNIDADYIAVIVTVVVGLLSAVTLVILALTLQKKTT